MRTLLSRFRVSRKDQAEINEFQPDALEIKNAPLPWWADCGMLWLACFGLVALTWSWLGQVDVIVTARGKIVSESPTIVIRPLERTVIKEIKVRVGDRVKKGQELITFDPVFSGADEDRLLSELNRYNAQLDRLKAEFNGIDYEFSDQTNERRWQYSLFLMRKKLYQERLSSYNEEIERLIQGAADKNKQLSNYYDIENLLLQIKRSITTREIKELQISRMQIEAEISSMMREKLSREAERNAFIEEWNANTVEEMVQIQQELTRTQKEYAKIKQLISYVSLYAPEDAIVHMISPISIGSAVREAESLITLVPLDGKVEAEVQLASEYVGKVKNGNVSRVKLTAFPFQKYGTIDGTVRYISGDTFSTENEEKGDQGNFAYYMARISLDNIVRTNKYSSDIFIIPGMEVQAEIVVGRRRIIEYIIHPLIKSLDEAMREP